MIYVTGDTHGDWVSRLSTDAFPEQKEMTKEDYVIVCGDFGIWNDTKQERYNLDWLEDKPFTTLFVDGNHENFDRLYAMPVSEWHGGKVHEIRPSVLHLMRGEIFEIEDKSFFVMIRGYENGDMTMRSSIELIIFPGGKKSFHLMKRWMKDVRI